MAARLDVEQGNQTELAMVYFEHVMAHRRCVKQR